MILAVSMHYIFRQCLGNCLQRLQARFRFKSISKPISVFTGIPGKFETQCDQTVPDCLTAIKLTPSSIYEPKKPGVILEILRLPNFSEIPSIWQECLFSSCATARFLFLLPDRTFHKFRAV